MWKHRRTVLWAKSSYVIPSCIRPTVPTHTVQAPDGTKGVLVGAPIAIIGEEGDDISGAAEAAEKAASSASKETPAKETKEEAPKPAEAPKSEPAPERKSESKADLPAGDRIFASPIAKKIALERGIPLSKVKGTGPEGRIIREDVEKYKPSAAAATSSTPAPAAADSADYVDTPVSNMRRVIGSRLAQSKQELPHYYVTTDITMDKVMKLREVFNKSLADKGAKLSVNDFIVKAVSCALSDVPEVNSAWLGEVIRTQVASFPRPPPLFTIATQIQEG